MVGPLLRGLTHVELLVASPVGITTKECLYTKIYVLSDKFGDNKIWVMLVKVQKKYEVKEGGTFCSVRKKV